MKTVLSISGGMDSTTLLAKLLDEGDWIECIHFSYGSKHNDKEIESIDNITHYYKVPLKDFYLPFIEENFRSNLLKSGGDVPEGHYAQNNMKQTVVPGRNSIFTTISAGRAESLDFDRVALAQHKGDAFIYPDCRPKFVESIKKTVELSSEGKVTVIAPFINIDKADICKIGLDLKVPYELTTTCYNGRDKACGKCGACVERIASFMKWKTKDPIPYEIDIDWEINYNKFLELQKI